MLNRTNRTLSANLNRLNLGTRSLVLKGNGINGKQTLRVRHAHGFAMRDGMSGSFDPSIDPSSRIGIPSIPGLSPVVSWPVVPPAVGHAGFPEADAFRTAVAACERVEQPGRAPVSQPAKGCKHGACHAFGAAHARAARYAAAARVAAAGG